MNITAIPPAPPRPPDAHKGTFGTVVVVGGSAMMVGAPALAASAALRAGAGLVKVLSHAQVIPHVLVIEPGATGLVCPAAGDDQAWRTLFAGLGERVVLAIGPGMGVSDESRRVLSVLLGSGLPAVVDADGLNNLAQLGTRIGAATSPLVLTPHPGEFRRLAAAAGLAFDPTDPAQRPQAAQALAKRYNAVVVLKGQHTVISDARSLYINSTGNPSLATAGSGDVLTGVIASFMAQGMEAFDASVLGVYIHGLAADLWAAQHGPCGLTARDLALLIPDALQRHRLQK